LDIDLLLWGERISRRPELTLPHPELRRRRFYLEPLAEIAPRMVVPPKGDSVTDLLATLELEGTADR
jgi:2-amino-4-hydroxy-6-hydroxymethyldihydropteridine diphosphokinase